MISKQRIQRVITPLYKTSVDRSYVRTPWDDYCIVIRICERRERISGDCIGKVP